MNYKRMSLVILAIIVSLFFSFFITRGAVTADASVDATGKNVVVYYFHGEFRCHTCLRIEELTKKAVTRGFTKELAESKIQFTAINVDRPGNEHFIQDYKLQTKSVIVAEYSGSKQIRWKNLPKIWEYHSNENNFINYIQSEVKGYLNNK